MEQNNSFENLETNQTNLRSENSTFQNSEVFEKTQNTLESKQNTPPSRSSFRTKFIFLIVLFIILVVGTYFGVQYLLEKKFETIAVDFSGDLLSQNDFQLQEEETEPVSSGESCSDVFVRIVSPNENTILHSGEEVSVSWDMCGISQSLVDAISLVYFDSETQEEIGTFDFVCSQNSGDLEYSSNEFTWSIPPYIEKDPQRSCSPFVEIDFADSFLYKIQASYASGQYKDVSDDFFSIDISNFIYQPPVFDEYSLDLVSDFSRAPFLHASAPQALHERIYPVYFQAPVEFANYYRVYTLGCGTGCVAGNYLIDVRDGMAYNAPSMPNYYITPVSSLYVSIEYPESTVSISGSHVDLDTQGKDALITWYNFDESTKDFTVIDEKYCNVEGGTQNYQFLDCIQP